MMLVWIFAIILPVTLFLLSGHYFPPALPTETVEHSQHHEAPADVAAGESIPAKVFEKRAISEELATKLTAFETWAGKNGLHFEKVYLSEADCEDDVFGRNDSKVANCGIGMFANRRISPNEKIICAKSKIMITEDSLFKTDFSYVMSRESGRTPFNIVLALFFNRMVWDRKSEPKGNELFGPYFDLISKEHSFFPNAINPEEVESVIAFPFEKAIILFDDVKRIILENPHTFDYPPRAAYSGENFAYFASFVQSRFTGPITSDSKTVYSEPRLIPGLDFINHKRERDSPYYRVSPGKKELCLISNRNYEPNEQIFIDYTKRDSCDSDMFNNYGFVDPELSTACFKLSLSDVSQLANRAIDGGTVEESDRLDRYLPYIENPFFEYQVGHRMKYITVKRGMIGGWDSLLPWARARVYYEELAKGNKLFGEDLQTAGKSIFCYKNKKLYGDYPWSKTHWNYKCGLRDQYEKKAEEYLVDLAQALLGSGSPGITGETVKLNNITLEYSKMSEKLINLANWAGNETIRADARKNLSLLNKARDTAMSVGKYRMKEKKLILDLIEEAKKKI